MVEDTLQNPCSPYARSKLAVEWMIRDFSVAYGLGYTILRYFNAAGASADGRHDEDHTPENHLIPIALQVAMGQRPALLVYGNDYPTPDGTCIRDYIHVDDLARAHLLAIQAMQPGTQEVFNVGTGQGHSVLEVIRSVESAVGRPIPYSVGERRPGDAPVLVAGSQKLSNKLSWQCKYSALSTIVESAWRWHRAHPHGYFGPGIQEETCSTAM